MINLKDTILTNIKKDIPIFHFFTEGAKVSQKWGYINKMGKLVIKTQFDNVEPFFNGLARVEVNGKHGYINKKGDHVWEPTS